jgi:nitrogen regulatory protein P-II 1
VRADLLERVEKMLQDLHVGGVSVSGVKGYGEYADLFARDWMSPYARVEIFTSAQHAMRIADGILAGASTGTLGDGIVAIEPVDSVLRVRDHAPVPADEI